MSEESKGFENDLADMLGELMKQDRDFCVRVWSALANVDWYNPKTKQNYSCSFRYAGGLISVRYIDAMGCVCAEILNRDIDNYYEPFVLTHDLSSRLWERDFIILIVHYRTIAYGRNYGATGFWENIALDSQTPRTRIVALCERWYAGKEDEVNVILEEDR